MWCWSMDRVEPSSRWPRMPGTSSSSRGKLFYSFWYIVRQSWMFDPHTLVLWAESLWVWLLGVGLGKKSVVGPYGPGDKLLLCELESKLMCFLTLFIVHSSRIFHWGGRGASLFTKEWISYNFQIFNMVLILCMGETKAHSSSTSSLFFASDWDSF